MPFLNKGSTPTTANESPISPPPPPTSTMDTTKKSSRRIMITPPRILRGAASSSQKDKALPPKLPDTTKAISGGGAADTVINEGATNATNNDSNNNNNNNKEGGAAANSNNNNAPTLHSGDALENYILPPILRMDIEGNNSNANTTNSGSSNVHQGIEVIKVSKNGKQQVRRLGIAPNNRAIYITSHKVQGIMFGKKIIKQQTTTTTTDQKEDHNGTSTGTGAALQVNEVDLSRVVRMQLGQQSRRFVKARTKQDTTTTGTPQSLSIIYRRSTPHSTKDKLVKTISKKGLIHNNNNAMMDAGEDSLDLIIPTKPDFDAFTRTLEDLLAFYQVEEPCANPDYAFIQYHMVDGLGKSLGGSSTVGNTRKGEDRYTARITCSDWVALCKRWNAPVTKAEATSMYRTFCESLAISNMEGGLEMFEVVRLLEVLRQRGLVLGAAAASSKQKTESNKTSSSTSAAVAVSKGEDPRKRLFTKISKSRLGACIAAEDFLAFLHEKQKETDMKLQDVKDLFHQLNGHRMSLELEDAVSIISGKPVQQRSTAGGADTDTITAQQAEVVWEREYITWEAFGRYLLLESNDVFDPERARPSHSYMNEPLNNYWINTCHDTYLRRTKASMSAEHKQYGKTDLQSYTLALYRGARAIELDVWDGPAGNPDPLVRFGVTSFSDSSAANKSSSSNSLVFADVILTISYFLQSEPNSFPVVLLIENHCSLSFQNKMASVIEEILGKQNLLYRPDLSARETGSSLPSPAQLMGKVVIKSKLPQKIPGKSLALNDDFDDENRVTTTPTDTDYDSEDDIKEYVIGFNSTGSIKSTTPQKITPEELFQTARSESIEATSAANAALLQLSDVKHQAQQSQNHADALLRDIGMTFDELKKKREEGIDDVVEEGTEVELCVDGASKVKEGYDQAMEISKAFAETVEESRLLAHAAATEARSESDLFDIAREDLTEKEAILAEANEELQVVAESNRELVETAERALSEARTNGEYAENAERRVMAVRGLVDRSHNQAVSSETVAGTADAEANISEQRASEAEARYQKARASADKERKNAEKETKLEDDLEAKLMAAHKDLSQARDAVDAARERADDAVIKAEKLTDEIREARSMGGYDDDASIGEGSVADEKTKERRAYIGEMEKALTDKRGLESSTRKLQSTIDEIRRKSALQAKVAASARRQADHSMSIADQLEEHALEEREAANLRQAARVKAKRGVESSDAVLTSTEGQLAEAEKAASEAKEMALASRQKAEQLAKEAEAIQDVSQLESNVREAKEIRDAAYNVYESALESKEEAIERSAKAKQVHETNCVNLANLERDAMAELLHKESVQQAEMLAVTACENAKALSDQVDALAIKCKEAEALANEKSGALAIATRYKEKTKRLQPVSPALVRLTLLDSCNLRNWEKSSQLPSYALHSIPDTRVIQKAEQGKEEWKSWVNFNKTHFSRTYPESATRNYNPLLPWAMGCQFASMNFIRNKFMLLNDGRFRENGGQGYVLKPGYLCDDTKGDDSVSDALDCTLPRKLSIRVLSGVCLPKSAEKKSGSSSINPFVRVTLYDASPASLLPSPVFKTQVVEGNGLNPVWNTQEAASFSCLNPSVGMILFAVYDHCTTSNTDLFIGASAMPVSCIREGYRCVPLFDSNNSRSGAMKFASLFVKVKIES